MTVFNPANAAELQERFDAQTGLIIACYCAAWCDTCRDYQTEFSRLSEQWPAHTFIWVDIEDHPELLGDHDVEDFPTILIQNTCGTLFFGEQLPYISHLDRLIKRTQQENERVIDGGPPLLRSVLKKT